MKSSTRYTAIIVDDDDPGEGSPRVRERSGPATTGAFTRIIAVANQKGGVGKTDLTVNLVCQLASSGKRVLLIDMDPQANATTTSWAQRPRSRRPPQTFCSTTTSRSATCCIRDCRENLDVAPASGDLERVPDPTRERHQHAVQAEEEAEGAQGRPEYDFVVIDTPPSLGILTVNTLTAANQVLIPVQTQYFAMEGVVQLLETVQKVKEDINPGLEVLGAVLTLYDRRTLLSKRGRGEGSERLHRRDGLHHRHPGQRQACRGAELPQVDLRVRLRLQRSEGRTGSLPRRYWVASRPRRRPAHPSEEGQQTAASHFAPSVPSGRPGVPFPIPRPGRTTVDSSSRPTSYNDVFFRKRSESRPSSSSPDAGPRGGTGNVRQPFGRRTGCRSAYSRRTRPPRIKSRWLLPQPPPNRGTASIDNRVSSSGARAPGGGLSPARCSHGGGTGESAGSP